ncbi:LysR family transcriptional regulator [uncultured Paraburkholderia sp.]|uniref:LysR family transcriptional regulator n=1 Tax=uncultured Paraburkholderia sp. TaxID=1822466 RepID=UPI00259A4938|nr:LysR family transcriptional regulator [uncultured Paraburkholderia sp.]
MQREDLLDLNAYAAVAEERSFTRAAVKLKTSQSALSYAIRRLETRLGVRLLHRTTRNVAPTDAGEKLLQALGPAFANIQTELDSLAEMRETPVGAVRINAPEHAVDLLWPKLETFIRDHPLVKLEIEIGSTYPDIVTGRFDAGIRLGEEVGKDMVAVRVGPEMRMIVVASPSYFAHHPKPSTPHDISNHDCIHYRRPSTGQLRPWEFAKKGRFVNANVEGQLIFNNLHTIIKAAKSGLGLAYLPEDFLTGELTDGSLVQVLADWRRSFSGYHLYYPSRRLKSAALGLLIEALKYRG